MKKLLHIIASPRKDESRTLKVSRAFLQSLQRRYPEVQIDSLDLCSESLPVLKAQQVNGKYILLGGKELSGEFKQAWRDILQQITRFLSADAYLLSTPMWNFSIPYVLKHYIDVIVQPNYLFRYTEQGPEGLVKNKKMTVISSRGGDYGPDSPFHSYDYLEPYLRVIFGFVGIEDITFINAQPMDAQGPQVLKEEIDSAQRRAKAVAENF